MNRNVCRATRQEIDQSELGERLSVMAEAHVGNCRECAQFRTERTSLRELVGGLTPVTAPSDFDMRLRARMAREGESRTRQPFIFRTLMSAPGIAVAAVLVMLIGSAVLLDQRKGTESANSTSTTPVNAPVQNSASSVNPTATGVTAAAVQNPLDVLAGPPKPQAVSSRSNKPAMLASRTNGSSDFAVSRAPSIRLSPDRAGEVSLTAPVNPMVVSVRDEHGATRRILLPPVSFGSQRLSDNRTPVSMNNTRDW